MLGIRYQKRLYLFRNEWLSKWNMIIVHKDYEFDFTFFITSFSVKIEIIVLNFLKLEISNNQLIISVPFYIFYLVFMG